MVLSRKKSWQRHKFSLGHFREINADLRSENYAVTVAQTDPGCFCYLFIQFKCGTDFQSTRWAVESIRNCSVGAGQTFIFGQIWDFSYRAWLTNYVILTSNFSIRTSAFFNCSSLTTWIHKILDVLVSSRCLMVSTDLPDPSCFYFRISWILMEWRWFYFFRPHHLVQGLRSKNIK